MIVTELEPQFTQSMAAAFFDLSSTAFRFKENQGYFINIENEDVTPKRGYTDNGNKKNRKYSLQDLRKIAHALRSNGKLTNRQLKIVIMRIDAFSEPLLTKSRKRMHKAQRI
jgi:hypothetical protein